MFAEERHEKIAKMLDESRNIKVSELVEMFGVSIETIRRDLVYLEAQGILKRVHGGAVGAARNSGFAELDQRLTEHHEEKVQMAKYAAGFIRENDCIAIDSGSTAVELAKVIATMKKSLTIVTHSIEVFDLLKNVDHFKVILLGGQYYQKEKAFYGPLLLEILEKIHVNISFVFPSAISLEYGIEDYILEMIPVQQGYMRIADRYFVVADHSKFEMRAFASLSKDLERGTIITDDRLPDEIYTSYIDRSIHLLRCGDQTTDQAED